MKFRKGEVDNFLSLFNERKELIKDFQGCTHLELWRDAHEANTYFTYSHWDSETSLSHYRFSDLFRDTWSKTKILFEDKPEAWSLHQEIVVS